MRKILITVFFVALTATPLAAQPMSAPAVAPRPVAMKVVPKTVAPRVTPRPVAMRPVPRPATTKPAPVAKAPVMAVAAPVAAMTAPATTPTAPVMAPDAPVAPTTAPAQVSPATKTDSKASVVGGWVLQLLLGILGIAVPIVLTPFVYWLLKKMKVEDAKAQMLIDETVDKALGVGIHYAEEQAHKLKDNPIDGAKKLDMAGQKAQAYLKDSKIVDKSAEYLKDLIEAKLGETRPAGVSGVKPAVVEAEPEAEEKKVEKFEEKKEANE